ncbi:hypothetical protein EC973_003870 [Apophysomyces ossiformis]|uniref:SAP domain-containing protein n=1 Tax=Apophysomyces ossiformis TaxID=679940 RepID=A0A8H7EKW6_9FUNG|nr:hypothetical protein EC973_003870 [Apophysomyces ossiformis]
MPTIVPSSLRVVDLRAELLKRKLPTKGKKDELIARLEEALKNEVSEEEGTTEEQNDSKLDEQGETKVKEKEEEKVVQQGGKMEPAQQQDEVKATEPVKEVTPIAETRSKEPPAAETGLDQVEDSGNKEMEVDHERGMKRKRQEDSSKLGKSLTISLLVIRPKAEPVSKAEEPAAIKDTDEQAEETIHDRPSKVLPETAKPEEVKKAEEESTEKVEGPVEQKEIRKDTEEGKSSIVAERRKEAEKITEVGSAESKKETRTISTSAIFIKGFLRPLIIRHVQEFIGKFGTVKRFWMDAIKTHCYVVYESQEEAQKAFDGIDGVVFPADTGRKLSVGGLTPEQAEVLIEQEQSAAEKRIRIDWEAAIKSVLESKGDPAAAVSQIDTAPARRSRPLGITAIAKQLQKAATAPIQQQPILQSEPEASLPVPEEAQLVEPQEASQSLSLDQLFRKTTTVPPLYYLTVPEEVAKKRMETLKNEPTR